LHTQIAYNEGTQNAVGVSGWEYDFTTLDAQTEYSIERKHLLIRPGISYRLAEYDDEKSIRRVGIRSALIDGRKQINSYAAYLRSEFDKGIFRLVGAVRGEKYNVPDKVYFSYQFAVTCSPGERYLIRAVHSRANRSSFILDSYYNQSFTYGPMSASLQGNTNLTLMQLDLYEVGFRTYFGKSVLFDIELFLNKAKNYAKLQSVSIDDPTNTLSMFQNLPTKADQYGATVSIDIVPVSFCKLKTYATYQHTYVIDYLAPNGTLENYLHRGSPDWYGGLVASIKFHKNLNLNVNPYFFSGYRIRTTKKTDHLWVEDCILLNAKLDYRLSERTFLFITARNIFSGKQPQVTWADPIGIKLLGGINFEF
jgi:iron complex outermembrane receptor protein